REVFTPGHELDFDSIDSPYLGGELHHGAGGEGLLDLDPEGRQARGRTRGDIRHGWMARQFVERGRPRLRDADVADDHQAARNGFDQKDRPAVWRIRCRTAGWRAAKGDRLSAVRPDFSGDRNRPHVALSRVSEDAESCHGDGLRITC